MRNKNAKVRDPNEFITDPGCDEHILYSSKILPNGEIRLTPCGSESMSEKINAEKNFTDINYIVSRLQLGDTSVLRDGALYGDFTRAPKSLADALQIRMDAEKAFYDLPKETRQEFNNNINQWLIEAGTEEWCKKMNIIQDSVVKEEVNADES